MEYNLKNWIWDEKDFERMDWHDATIHAVAFLPETYEFAVDLDYIIEWGQPTEDNPNFKLWMSPVTMIFENVHDLRIDLDIFDTFQLETISRKATRKPPNAEYIEKKIEWKWILESDAGKITLWSVGYKFFFRRKPILANSQVLTLAERGGFSFMKGKA